MDKKILDVTCGARSIWFDKHHPAAVYCDKRREQYHHLWKNAGNCTLDINPDVMCDFTELPFPDNSFPLVVFDPPHLTGAKETAWLVKKYGETGDNSSQSAPNAPQWFSGVYAGFETRRCTYFQVVGVRHPGGRSLESHWTKAAVWTSQRKTEPHVLGVLYEIG